MSVNLLCNELSLLSDLNCISMNRGIHLSVVGPQIKTLCVSLEIGILARSSSVRAVGE